MRQRFSRGSIAVAFLTTLAVTALAQSSPAQPVTVGPQRELFVDSHLIDSLNGARLELHPPRPAGSAVVFDKPWEGIYCAYATVIKDAEKYRLYYRGHPGGGDDGSEIETTCYAESDDGIVWTKPNLGLFEVLGTKDNNVVLVTWRELGKLMPPTP